MDPKRRVFIGTLAVLVASQLLGSLAAFSQPPEIGGVEPLNSTPTAEFTADRTLMAVAVDASASTDPDGTIADYLWEWGDGTADSSGTSPMHSHAYATPGKYVISLSVTDSGGAVATAARLVTVNTHTIDYEFYDFFNVPFGEWWDYRARVYGESPIGAECWNATAIANGVCSPTLPDVPDVPSYPYTIWTWTEHHRVIYAPYRMRVTAVDVPGYDLSQPVFLPVTNDNQPAGGFLDFRWYAQFLDSKARQALRARGCPIDAWGDDGYIIRSEVSLTMDLQESRRIFGVDATDPRRAQEWWDSNIDPSCAGRGPVEQMLLDWLYRIDGTKYDIWNTYYFWYLGQLYLDMRAVVDTDGTTHVTFDQVAWGMANLLGRMFYWGNTSYVDHYLDSTKAAGWFGMEPWGWFEDLTFSGSLAPSSVDFELTTVLVFHLSHIAFPGPDGFIDRIGDVPAWTWRPNLADWVIPRSQYHPYSEVLRYPGVFDIGSTPGDAMYGEIHPRDFVPTVWDLEAGETWHFQFPTGNVVFYDPNLTPSPANPRSNDFVKVVSPLNLAWTAPGSFGTWDAAAYTWDVVGPELTGGPAGSPGPDRLPGTADDEYPNEPWGAIYLVPGTPIEAMIQAPWTRLYPGQPMDVAVVAMAQESPLPGAAVTASAPGATLTPSSGMTDASGRWTSTITPHYDAAGTTIILSAGVAKAPMAPDSASHSISVLVEPLSMSIASMTSNRQEMMSFEVATIRVRLDSGGAGVEDGLLTPSTRFGGTFTAVTDLGGGAYEFGWTAPVRTTQGFARIDVRARAGGYTDATSFTTILVDPNKTNEIDPTQLFLLTSLPATSVVAGGTLQVTIYLFTIEGFVVSGGTVTARLFGPGSVTLVRDELNGVYRLTYNAPASVAGPTNIRIDITANKFGYAVGTTRVGITVLPAA